MDVLQISGGTNRVAIGYMTQGNGAPAPLLFMDWDTFQDILKEWAILNLCDQWEVTIEGDQLTVSGSASQPIPIQPAVAWGNLVMQECAIPSFSGSWTLRDPVALGFFKAGLDRMGYFLLLPTLQGVPAGLPPLLCLLKRDKSPTTSL